MNTTSGSPEGRRPPSTPEGRALRDARVLAGLTADEVADKAGIPRSTYGNMERGRQPGRDRDYHAEAAKVALACAALGVSAEQMDTAGRADVANILRGGSVPGALPGDRPALALVPDELADEMIESWIADQDEGQQAPLWWRWRETDSEGRLLPRDIRLRGVVYWRDNFMPKPPGGGVPASERHDAENTS